MAETDGVVLCAVQDMLMHPEIVESAAGAGPQGSHTRWIAVGSDKYGVPNRYRR
jgi:hypothetical protein